MIKKAISYVRVSSKEQEREGFSIPAQKKYLEEYALRHDMQIVHVFEESESAKAAGRTQFKAMLEFLRKNKDIEHILVEKTDRLYRNLKDYSLLDPTDWPHLEIHLTKENEVLSINSKSHQKFIHGIKVLTAKNYSDNLSEEVKKGMTEKAKQGLYPSVAPIGYLNNRQTHTIEPDPKVAPLIKHGFELGATGQYSLSKLKKILYDKGLRSKRARNEISKSQMQRILINPIYYGDFTWNGEYYKGTHLPIISKDIFDKAQSAMGFKKIHTVTKKSFAYAKVMTCAHCGCVITAEEKIKPSGRRYIYYRCTKGKGLCDGVVYIREEKIEDWIADALTRIQLSEEIVEWSETAIQRDKEKEHRNQKHQLQTLESQYRSIKHKINRAYEDKLEGTIDQNFWSEQNTKWTLELSNLEGNIQTLNGLKASPLEETLGLMRLSRKASTLFRSMVLPPSWWNARR